jgi:polyisoprenoid-binding protein YceI
MRLVLIAALAMVLPATALAQSEPAAQSPPPETAKPAAKLPAGHYRLDSKHANLNATVRHLGVSNYVIRFDKFDADFTYDPAQPEATKLTASVDVTSFDVHADYGRKFANDFLSAEKFPQATFTSTSMTPAADGRSGTMTGDLTLMGVTKPVTFDVTFIAVGHGFPFGTIAGFTASTTIRRSDFGSREALHYVGDETRLEISGEFDRKSE